MRNLSEAEMLNLNKLLQAETYSISKARMIIPAIDDEKLKGMAETSVLACEMRIKGIQQFINENGVINTLEVH
ncbi:MAG: hypothetical protein APF77_07755 [Clostridia bacterium BRH_c25]|nr:MAG: hypothetical protein APF77_07755 [Clostridia bacterium BRH_c25]